MNSYPFQNSNNHKKYNYNDFRNQTNVDKKNYNHNYNNSNIFNSKTLKIDIEYEKISKNDNNNSEESENFNVYFMKPDLKFKTIPSTSSKISKYHFPKKVNKLLTSDIKNEEEEFKKEKEFKVHLIQKLKSLKSGKNIKDKIKLNFASKIRREESIRNSLKFFLDENSQFEQKKELIYYKAYFRFWRRKCKKNNENKGNKNKRVIKKDKNIRITTVIYRDEKYNKSKGIKVIKESKNENKEKDREDTFNKKLRINLENKSKEKLRKENLYINQKLNDNKKIINKNERNQLNISSKINKESSYYNNIKIIKNNSKISNENKNINNNFEINKKYELSNNQKEALNKLNQNIKKEFQIKGFNQFTNYRNKSREEEGAENKKEIINNLKKNQYINKIIEFNIIIENFINKKIIEKFFLLLKQYYLNIQEKEINYNIDEDIKWTNNKFNWQIETLTKEQDSLYGFSEEELKESNLKNSISIEDNGRSLKEIFGSNITFKNKEEFINEEESNNEIGQINNNNEKEKNNFEEKENNDNEEYNNYNNNNDEEFEQGNEEEMNENYEQNFNGEEIYDYEEYNEEEENIDEKFMNNEEEIELINGENQYGFIEEYEKNINNYDE